MVKATSACVCKTCLAFTNTPISAMYPFPSRSIALYLAFQQQCSWLTLSRSYAYPYPMVDPLLAGSTAYANLAMPYAPYVGAVDSLYANPAFSAGVFPSAALAAGSMYGGLYNRYAYNPYNRGLGFRGMWSGNRWRRCTCESL